MYIDTDGQYVQLTMYIYVCALALELPSELLISFCFEAAKDAVCMALLLLLLLLRGSYIHKLERRTLRIKRKKKKKKKKMARKDSDRENLYYSWAPEDRRRCWRKRCNNLEYIYIYIL